MGWLARWTWFPIPRSFRCINPLRITRAMLRGRACFPFRRISSLVRLFPASSEILLHLLLTLRFFVGRELPRGKLSAANIFFCADVGFCRPDPTSLRHMGVYKFLMQMGIQSGAEVSIETVRNAFVQCKNSSWVGGACLRTKKKSVYFDAEVLLVLSCCRCTTMD